MQPEVNYRGTFGSGCCLALTDPVTVTSGVEARRDRKARPRRREMGNSSGSKPALKKDISPAMTEAAEKFDTQRLKRLVIGTA